MSIIAPWLALSCDWMDSEMFDESSHGHRLAWICLLCHAKAQGRAGKVRFRDMVFADKYRLSIESVNAMVASATKAGAVTVKGDVLTFVNWKSYQDPRMRSDNSENHRENSPIPKKSQRFTKTSENDATKHPPPSTKHPPPPPTPATNPSAPDPVPLSAEWSEVVVVVGKCGVGNAEAACEAARDRQATPGEVRRLCEDFQKRPGAWGPGLLHSMISKIRAGEKISWPEPSAEYAERQRTLTAAEKKTEREQALAKQSKRREAYLADVERSRIEHAANPINAAEEFRKLAAKNK